MAKPWYVWDRVRQTFTNAYVDFEAVACRRCGVFFCIDTGTLVFDPLCERCAPAKTDVRGRRPSFWVTEQIVVDVDPAAGPDRTAVAWLKKNRGGCPSGE